MLEKGRAIDDELTLLNKTIISDRFFVRDDTDYFAKKKGKSVCKKGETPLPRQIVLFLYNQEIQVARYLH